MADVKPEEKGAESPSLLPPGMHIGDRSQHFLREVIETILLTAIIFLVVHVTVQPFQVDGPSMQPGLHTGEYVLVNQLAYKFSAPKRGDVVVLHNPLDPNGDALIKRIIAVPGDTLSINDDSITVNGVTLKEPYVLGSNVSPCGQFYDVKIAPGQYYVLGDHRSDSLDSRCFAGVPSQNIIGRAELVVWPPGSIEHISSYPDVFEKVKP